MRLTNEEIYLTLKPISGMRDLLKGEDDPKHKEQQRFLKIFMSKPSNRRRRELRELISNTKGIFNNEKSSAQTVRKTKS
jgi:hypothetical protein